METPTKKEIDCLEKKTVNEEFLSFLELYQENQYPELLHEALYYLSSEGEANKEKQEVANALYFVRNYLNDLSEKYLPTPNK